MSSKNFRILSLDISSSCTGWSFISNRRSSLKFGTIKPDSKITTTEKLHYFREELLKLFKRFKPTYVVLEDTFLGINPKVVKLLAKFGGVAEQAVYEHCKQIPHIMGNTTPKSFFKVKDKKGLFLVVLNLMGYEDDNLPAFSKWNDITDSIAQLFCYCDEVLRVRTIRQEKEYGFKYEF